MKESQLALKIKKYLKAVIQQGGSDLHLSVGFPVMIRVDGKLIKLEEEELLTKEDMEMVARLLLNEERLKKLYAELHIDFSFEFATDARFRANMFFQRGVLSLVMRLIPNQILSLEELNIPNTIYNLTERSQGLVLVTGPMGHGKSTTLASLIDYINHRKQKHIITIEDPIEYVYQSDQSLIEQREIFQDARDFQSALKACFREDADVILVGEMRDLETIQTVMTAAETGHLVLATLHTNDSTQTVDRIIDIFPPFQQNQIRIQLSNVLLGVVSQRLIPKVGGGRVPAVEILLKNKAVENLIRQNQTHQMGVVLETSKEEGMVSLDRSLAQLVKAGVVSIDEAECYSTDRNSFQMFLESGY
jgi:twitching motility protein PilT